MSGWILVSIGAPLLGLVGFLAMREISLYRRDVRDHTNLVVYTRRRLKLRLAVSAGLGLEIFLLFLFPSLLRVVGPVILKGSQSGWFVLYVGLVILIALGLMVLAYFDLKESGEQLEKSEKQLLSELIHEVKQGQDPPHIH